MLVSDEVMYRLLPIPVLLWLISSLALRGRAQTQVLWTLAQLTSLIEFVTQNLHTFQAGAVALSERASSQSGLPSI